MLSDFDSNTTSNMWCLNVAFKKANKCNHRLLPALHLCYLLFGVSGENKMCARQRIFS